MGSLSNAILADKKSDSMSYRCQMLPHNWYHCSYLQDHVKWANFHFGGQILSWGSLVIDIIYISVRINWRINNILDKNYVTTMLRICSMSFCMWNTMTKVTSLVIKNDFSYCLSDVSMMNGIFASFIQYSEHCHKSGTTVFNIPSIIIWTSLF